MIHLISFPLVPFYTTPTNPSPTTNLFEPLNLNPISTQSLSFPISTQTHFFKSHIFHHQPFVFLFLKLHPLISFYFISFTKPCHWVSLPYSLMFRLFLVAIFYPKLLSKLFTCKVWTTLLPTIRFQD